MYKRARLHSKLLFAASFLPALFVLPGSVLVACSSSPDGQRDVEVRVGGVGIDPISEAMVVVLEEAEGGRILPILIGSAEARSIALEIENLELPRPNTHDLARRLLNHLEAQLERVVVTDLKSGTYFAVLVIRANGRRMEIDARPSDAIAIALRAQAPVFVRDGLFKASIEAVSDDEANEAVRL